MTTTQLNAATPPPTDNAATDAAYAEALRVMQAEIAELRAKGIITGGEGSRDALLKPDQEPLPGGLARFLASRGF